MLIPPASKRSNKFQRACRICLKRVGKLPDPHGVYRREVCGLERGALTSNVQLTTGSPTESFGERGPSKAKCGDLCRSIELTWRAEYAIHAPFVAIERRLQLTNEQSKFEGNFWLPRKARRTRLWRVQMVADGSRW